MLKLCLLALLMLNACISAPAANLTWKELPPLPDKLGVAGPFAGVSGGALIVAGGANFPEGMPWDGGKKVWHDTVWLLGEPSGQWREVGRLPRPLGYGISVTWQDSVICVSGSDHERHYQDAFRLIWKNGRLTSDPLPALPTALSGASGALTENSLYVAGGSDRPGEQSATNRAFVLDLTARPLAWQELPPIPGRPRFFATGAAHDHTFYLFGGAALKPGSEGRMVRDYLKEVWSYHPGHGWLQLADLPQPSVAAASPAPFVDGRFLLIGGDDGSLVDFRPLTNHPGFPKSIVAYDLALDRWAKDGEAPAPRATVPCVPWHDRFVVPSGELRPGVRSPEVWSFLIQ